MKATRALVYAAYNMGGTADWAVDLQSFAGDGADSSDGASTVIIVDPSIVSNPILESIPNEDIPN